MCMNNALPCASLCCPSSDRPNFLHNSYAQRKIEPVNYLYHTLYCDTPISAANTTHLPSLGGITSADQAFSRTVIPDYAQQPPDYVIDYWFHHLGLSHGTTLAGPASNSPRFPFSSPVVSDFHPSVSLVLVIQHHML